MIAAITLKMLDPFGTGKLVLFQVTYDKVGIILVIYHGYSLTAASTGLARVRIDGLSFTWGLWGMWQS
jgi:hypothetical protein